MTACSFCVQAHPSWLGLRSKGTGQAGPARPQRRTDMIGDLFDSPWKVLIVAVVLIVLFGSKKLPHAARSLGQSMRILKKEVQGLHEDQSAAEAASPSGAA